MPAASMVEMDLKAWLAAVTDRVDRELDRLTPAETAPPETIHKAMRYSLFAGGKRVRPALCVAAAECVAGDAGPRVYEAACSLEYVHAYSLVHDDLPDLDNDDLRRGRPTNHKVFGNAMAILAGDALQCHAFVVLSRLGDARLVEELAVASGTVGGMIGGQVHDIEGEGQPPTAELLERIHRAKTGALLRASVRLGAMVAQAAEEELAALTSYGEHVGLAFQIVDDILDVTQSSEQLGKTAGKDVAQGKVTFPAVYGLEASHRMAKRERSAAHASLERFGARARRLREIADLVVERRA